jgi:CDP-paratose 2-epimerase
MHSGTELHGFLSYLTKCGMTGREYRVFGYKGKQVRDNIHSADLISAFDCFFASPRVGEVYNIGGGRFSNCSLIEGMRLVEQVSGRPFKSVYVDTNRIGDHIWYISDLTRFQTHFPQWKLRYNCERIIREIYEANSERWK